MKKGYLSKCTKVVFFTLLVFLLTPGNLLAEVFPNNKNFDKYGGYVSIKGTATGLFHLEKINNRHFLITPDGHGFFSIGVTHTGGLGRAEESKCDHLKENCGGDWAKANKELLVNFRKWGYNSLGYDSHVSTRKILPHFGSCYPTGKTSSWLGKKIQFPDVFSSAWKKAAEATIQKMAKQYKGNQNLIGVYWTDMPAWDLKQARQSAGKTWVDAIRELPESAAGKKRYKKFLSQRGKAATDEEFTVLIAKEVYSHIGPITRKLFPKTLIFGERYSGRALPSSVIKEALPWIDVVSVQPDAVEFPKESFDSLYRLAGKPIMICDHQSSFKTPEHSNVMWRSLADVESVGKAHATYMNEGFSTSYLIGYNRCQYIDRFKSKGRQGILKQGLLKVDGTPYPKLVESVLENNWKVHKQYSEKK
ncbi:MAG: hypothetical protein NE330_13015 [Lentisphaeraceae bacterium]|nr:hypothetical protein [Lentisphaeraceae bacterium]